MDLSIQSRVLSQNLKKTLSLLPIIIEKDAVDPKISLQINRFYKIVGYFFSFFFEYFHPKFPDKHFISKMH